MKNNVKIIISVISVVVVVFLVCFALWSIGTEKTEYTTENIYDAEDFKLIQTELYNILSNGKTIGPNLYTYNTPFKYYLQRTGFYNKYIIICERKDKSYHLIHNKKKYQLLKKENDQYIIPIIPIKQIPTKQITTTEQIQEMANQGFDDDEADDEADDDDDDDDDV